VKEQSSDDEDFFDCNEDFPSIEQTKDKGKEDQEADLRSQIQLNVDMRLNEFII
jgi:hypothetical protein